MLDHLEIGVTDMNRSKDFYVKTLASLSIDLIAEVTAGQSGSTAHAGFGAAGKPFFWIGETPQHCNPVHVAFTAPSREAVDSFYRTALAAGGLDNGAPGPRPQYHAHYYGAFVRDPDGHNIEAVCHEEP